MPHNGGMPLDKSLDLISLFICRIPVPILIRRALKTLISPGFWPQIVTIIMYIFVVKFKLKTYVETKVDISDSRYTVKETYRSKLHWQDQQSSSDLFSFLAYLPLALSPFPYGWFCREIHLAFSLLYHNWFCLTPASQGAANDISLVLSFT